MEKARQAGGLRGRGPPGRVLPPLSAPPEGKTGFWERTPRAAPPHEFLDPGNVGTVRSSRRTVDVRRGLSGLGTVASSAPFVGLLGTVLGIITAFQLMATSGSGGLASVSAGISEALITTAFGLLVAIPALMMYNYLTNRVEEMSVDIADASNELVDFFLKEGRFDEPLTNPGAKPATATTTAAKA